MFLYLRNTQTQIDAEPEQRADGADGTAWSKGAAFCQLKLIVEVK